ncbi:MAG: M6 family metalloprotease domain-containing protein, partial [Chloroflexota bacterium]
MTFTIVQPDGITTFEARVWGDERVSGLETLAGYTVLQDSRSNYWFYADIDRSNGQLKTTHKIAGKDQPPATARGARPIVMSGQAQPLTRAAVGVPSVPVLVLMVQYANRPPLSTDADWGDALFGPTHSVQDYYRQISYHQLTLTPAHETCGTPNDGLTGWLTLGATHPNAGGPSIALAALSAADACTDYALFDKNGDNQITADELLPIIIVAGYEGSYGGSFSLTPNVWGHQSSVNYHSVGDGVTVYPYAQFGEWHATTWDNPGHRATIGLMVHEVGHLLGWPDLYDNSPPGNPDSEGVGEWSVMGTGLWLGTTYLGDTPAHPSAWEKWYQGWLTPLQLQGAHLNQPIPRVEDNRDNSVIQLLDNPYHVDWSFGESSGSGEYFLVENRQNTGYDARLPGCGLLIWHIDESVVSSNWANSDENHKLVDLEEADGLSHLDQMANRGDGGDPYPGTNNNLSFNNLTNPHSRLYNGSASGISITNISNGCTDIKSATFTAPHTVEMTKTAGRQPVVVGELLPYTLTVSNSGSTTVTGLVFTDVIPPHTTLNASSLSSDAGYSGIEPGSIITWTPALDLPPGQTLTRTFTVTVDLGVPNSTIIANTAYFTSNIRSGSSTVATTVA